jgi:hypothetical protein
MELKTASGVSIKIIDEGSSKILFFNKSVRAVELNKQETSKISAMLVSNLETKVNGAHSRRRANSTGMTKKALSEGM